MESATPFLDRKKQKMSTDGDEGAAVGEDERRKMTTPPRKASASKVCQADRCSVDLSFAKTYHRRHKVCEPHSKAHAVLVAGIWQRFCQQCSRFHELGEFDESKRSCRRRLAGHNERRRKNPVEAGERLRKGRMGSGGQQGRRKRRIRFR